MGHIRNLSFFKVVILTHLSFFLACPTPSHPFCSLHYVLGRQREWMWTLVASTRKRFKCWRSLWTGKKEKGTLAFLDARETLLIRCCLLGFDRAPSFPLPPSPMIWFCFGDCAAPNSSLLPPAVSFPPEEVAGTHEGDHCRRRRKRATGTAARTKRICSRILLHFHSEMGSAIT